MRRKVLMVVLAVAVALVPVGVMAADALNPICNGGGLSEEQMEAAGCGESGKELEEKVPGVINVIFWVTGVLAVGMIIYAGVRMIIAQGDAGKVAQEKKTIIYSVIGLMVAIAAYAIVNFVVGNFS